MRQLAQDGPQVFAPASCGRTNVTSFIALRQSYQSLTPQIAPFTPPEGAEAVITTNYFWFATVNTGHRTTSLRVIKICVRKQSTTALLPDARLPAAGCSRYCCHQRREICFSNSLIFWRKHQRMLRGPRR